MSPYEEPAWVGEMARTRAMIEMREAQKAKEPARTYRVHPEDVRSEPEPMAKAIKRNMKGVKRRA